MDTEDTTEELLTSFTHDLFLNNEYLNWRKNIKSNTEGEWHSLILSLCKNEAPLEKVKSFGEGIYSKLVFNYVKAPDYRKSKMLMIQFTISESMWCSLVWHCPERN
jgi:hypothetical protein